MRYGWALTVNKAMSYKWDEVIIDVGKSEHRGKTNRDYFKWIYTGLTRALNKVYLVNYKAITPLYKSSIKDISKEHVPDKNIYLIADKEADVSDFKSTTSDNFNFPEGKQTSTLIQLFQLLKPKLNSNNIIINSIEHPAYQEIYQLTGENAELAVISFYYNKKGQVKLPTLKKCHPSEFGDKVMNLLTDVSIRDFDFIKDKWRANCYEQINDQLEKIGGQCSYIIQSPYKDSIKISKDSAELYVEMNYDGDDFYSKINGTYYNDVELWKNFKNILLGLQNVRPV